MGEEVEDLPVAFGVPGFAVSDAERMGQLVAMVGGPTKAAEAAGVSRNAVHEWMRGKARMPLPAALALAQRAGVTLDWVATGYDRRPDLATSPGMDGFVAVRRLEVRASAGSGLATVGGGDETSALGFRTEWLRTLGVAPGNAEFLTAQGDSMEPTIRDGDLLLVDRGFGRVANGKIYVLVVNDLVIVKRINVLAFGGLMLISDNKDYPAETIPGSQVGDLSIEARVAWFGRGM